MVFSYQIALGTYQFNLNNPEILIYGIFRTGIFVDQVPPSAVCTGYFVEQGTFIRHLREVKYRWLHGWCKQHQNRRLGGKPEKCRKFFYLLLSDLSSVVLPEKNAPISGYFACYTRCRLPPALPAIEPGHHAKYQSNSLLDLSPLR